MRRNLFKNIVTIIMIIIIFCIVRSVPPKLPSSKLKSVRPAIAAKYSFPEVCTIIRHLVNITKTVDRASRCKTGEPKIFWGELRQNIDLSLYTWKIKPWIVHFPILFTNLLHFLLQPIYIWFLVLLCLLCWKVINFSMADKFKTAITILLFFYLPGS